MSVSSRSTVGSLPASHKDITELWLTAEITSHAHSRTELIRRLGVDSRGGDLDLAQNGESLWAIDTPHRTDGDLDQSWAVLCNHLSKRGFNIASVPNARAVIVIAGYVFNRDTHIELSAASVRQIADLGFGICEDIYQLDRED